MAIITPIIKSALTAIRISTIESTITNTFFILPIGIPVSERNLCITILNRLKPRHGRQNLPLIAAMLPPLYASGVFCPLRPNSSAGQRRPREIPGLQPPRTISSSLERPLCTPCRLSPACVRAGKHALSPFFYPSRYTALILQEYAHAKECPSPYKQTAHLRTLPENLPPANYPFSP
jgi:hypothetical protein